MAGTAVLDLVCIVDRAGWVIYLPNSDDVQSLIYSLMACQMVNESLGQHLKCLIGLSFGALLVMTAYWVCGNLVSLSRSATGVAIAGAFREWAACSGRGHGVAGAFDRLIRTSGSADRFCFSQQSDLLAQMAYLCDAHSDRLVFTSLVSTMSHGALPGLQC